MGDPKKIKKKYSTPAHPWQKSRLEEESILKKEYGLKNKQELWVMLSILKNFKNQVKKLNAMIGQQAEKETEQLKNKLLSLGLTGPEAPLDTILGLEPKHLMERRLQTILFRKKLARSISQARQFIVHRHVTVNGIVITAPSHLVTIKEESQISFIGSSALSDPNHPERYEDVSKQKVDKNKLKEEKRKQETEEIAAFEEVHEDEEEIVKDFEKKKETKKPEETQSQEKGEDKK